MKKIYLSGSDNFYTLVDDEDYEWLAETKWSNDGSGYAIRRVKGKNTTEKMHRLILNAKPGEQVDHINRLPYDNRRENLRLVTNVQNSRNREKYRTNKTGYKGVAVYKENKWTAQITVEYKKIHLGVFTCTKQAALAYNEAAKQHFGEFAQLNVIEEV